MNNLQALTNSELANEMHLLTKRFGELSLWIAEADLKVFTMITSNKEVQSTIAREIDLKHNADLERYIILSNLKKIELEMDKRVTGMGQALSELGKETRNDQ